MADLDSVILYSIFPNVPGMLQGLIDFNIYNHCGLSYFALLGVSIGISFLVNIFDTKF